MRALASFLALSLAACTATLRDGTYDCTDGQCPSGMTCGADHICHFGSGPPPDMGMMPGPDMGMMPPIDMGVMPPIDMGGPSHCAPACGAGEDCVVGAWTSPMPGYQCATIAQIMTATHGATCTMGTVCVSPDVCIPGSGTMRCMRPCASPGTDNCGFGETCIAHGGAGGICAHPCNATAPQCPSGGAVCVGGYCMPPSF